jgi:hypothetical protein
MNTWGMMAQRRASRNPVSRLYRILRRKARTLRRLVFPPEIIPFTAQSAQGHSVAAFFADTPSKIYQIAQWIPVFEKAPAHLRPVIITRHAATTEELQKLTSLLVIHARTYDLLMQLLELSKFKALIYVNNSYQNFQTLAYQQAGHIHVNHGESDKISMVSNQSKAYDRVFVAGAAARDRYLSAVAWIDESKLIPIGRPQLDLDTTPILEKSALKTITYAPTWEGEDEANNYTSMDCYGTNIIDAALKQESSRVIYKPHPRIIDSKDPAINAAHKYILSRLSKGPHEVHLSGDVLSVLKETDLLISDISSVTLDFLYLRPSGAIFLSDRRNNRSELEAESPVARAAYIIDRSSIDSLAKTLGEVLANDELFDRRQEVCRYYFGGIAAGASTAAFYRELERVITNHESAISKLSRVRRSN